MNSTEAQMLKRHEKDEVTIHSRGRVIGIISLALIIGVALFSVPLTNSGTSSSPKIQHVIWITMENREFSDVIGNWANAPYQNKLAVEYALPTQFYGVAHPSLPDYIASTAGNKFGISTNLIPSQLPQSTLRETNIVDLLKAHNLSWKVYAESTPYPNRMQVNSANQLYVPRHNPLVYYHDITGNYGTGAVSQYALSHIVPFTLTGFQKDLNAGKLANFTDIVPNMIDSAHSSSTLCGDQFLQKLVPMIQKSKFWSSTVIFIFYDEARYTSGGFTMPDGAVINGGRTVCIIISPYAKTGFKDSIKYSSYSILATTEKILRLGNLGRHDAVANAMSDLFIIPLGS
jgi:phospholipase C